jgi:hypothetical protein
MRVAITGWSLFSKWLRSLNRGFSTLVEDAKLKMRAALSRVRRTSFQNASPQLFFNAGHALGALVGTASALTPIKPINTTSCGKLL